MGFSLILEYDENVFTPISVTAGEMLSGGSLVDSIGGTIPAGQLKVTYCADKNITADGTLFYVNFAAAENISGKSTVNISYIQKDTFDENFENVIFSCESFDVSVIIPDDGKVRFYSDSATVDAGDELVVPVYVSNAESLKDFTLTLSFNNELFTFRRMNSDFDCEVIDNNNGTLTVKFGNLSAETNDVLLLNAVFDVAEYIETKETIEITCNSSVESVCTNADVSVVNPYADSPAFIYTDKNITTADGYIDIPVYINNNHGIMGFGMNVSYDSSALEPVSVIRGGVISGGSFDNNTGLKQGTFKVVWSNSENVTDNGLLFTLRFRILDGQKIKKVPVEISYSQPDTFNEKWEDVVLDIRIDTIIIADNSPKTVMISKRTLFEGDTVRLLPSCNFEVTEKVWISSNPDVATVDNHGNVTAVGKGECIITVKCCGRDSLGNEVQSTAKTKIAVNEKSEANTVKEFFREAFDNFFKVKLYDFAENLRGFIRLLLRIAY